MALHQPLRISVISLFVVGALGCSSVSENTFSSQANNSLSLGNQRLLSELHLPTQQTETLERAPTYITDLVDISELDYLLDQAFANNPSLQQSTLALKIAYAQQSVTNSGRLPTANAEFSGTRKEDTDDSYTADLTVSWELDLWQKIADSNNAALKDVAISASELQQVQDILAADIMRSWLDISLKQQLLLIEEKRLTVQESNQKLILNRYRAGLDNLEDLDSAKSSSASTSATVVDYTEQLEQSKRSLTLLLGQLNYDEVTNVTVDASFPDVLNPIDVLPNQDLAQRPDLKAAFYSIEAESLRTDAAYKAMLPSINLSASLSDIAESPSEALFNSTIWSVLGKLSAPLFQGGKLKAEAEIAELTTAKSFWIYQDTLLTAVNEVENTVGQEYSLQKQQVHITDALDSAKRSYVTYEEKYRQGLVDIFDLLTAQQSTFDLESQLTQITYNRLVNRIDLGLALGLGVSQ